MIESEEVLHSKPSNGMHFLDPSITKNLAICLSPICKGTEKMQFLIEEEFPIKFYAVKENMVLW